MTSEALGIETGTTGTAMDNPGNGLALQRRRQQQVGAAHPPEQKPLLNP